MLMGTDCHDFMSNALCHNDEDVCAPLARESISSKSMQTGMTKEEIVPTFAILLLAGSETTATLLSTVTFYLLEYPEVMKKLVHEIRTSFHSEDEITQVSLDKL